MNTDINTSMKKTLLCYTMIINSNCPYGNKCKYAHGLKNQHVNPVNKFVYDSIKKNTDLSLIDLSKEGKLYDRLLVMTNVCGNCANKKCHGGYNCKNGAIDEMFVICYNDLIGGNCKDDNCKNVHLTKQGLKPYNKFLKNPPNILNILSYDSDSDSDENNFN